MISAASAPTTPADTRPEARLEHRMPDHPWAADLASLYDALDTNEQGLTPDEVERRRALFGPNTLREVEPVRLWVILINQLKSLVVGLLLAAAGVSLLFGDLIEAVAIGLVLVLNTAIGFFMEWRALRSMEALSKVGSVPAIVRRSGTTRRVDAADLVPGDVVLLDEGDVITADLRLIETSRLQIDEAALTGESVPVDKDEAAISDDTPLAERASMAYKGTSVTRGSGEGLVVATGMATELGEISALVEEADQDDTPLEDQLDRLARSLVLVVLILAVAVAGAGIYAGRDLRLMIETGIALAVAAIPEGLPIVATIALARGLRRMARRNALVRRLSSVETLGATSVICTDKTGTLTENRMTVTRLVLPARRSDHEAAIAEVFDLTPPGPPVRTAPDNPLLQSAAQIAALCNTATDTALSDDGASLDDAVGDPMEIALLRFAVRVDLDPAVLDNRFPEVDRVAFERESKMMASLRRAGNSPASSGVFVAVKGAPEAVLEACVAEARPGPADDALCLTDGPAFTEDRRQYWLDQNEALAADGLRVLGLAAKCVASHEGTNPYADLQFVGLVGLVDPPRDDVRPSIEACHRAGIRVVMVTGDQPATAGFIARSVGLEDGSDPDVIHGRDFDALLDTDRERLVRAPILARVTPRQKLDLIDLHQEHGRIVAMTGDGVNDAPALKSADIGVAMGQRGTQVAQEAADMVLQDDAFSTIVAAVEEGRAIFNNIRAFVRYLLSCNVGEVMVVGLAAFAGLTIPLLPLQILFLNLVTDVFPALALGVAEAESDVMDHPPRPAEEPVLQRSGWAAITAYGVLFTVAVLGALLISRYALELPPSEAITISFLTLAFAQLWHVFNMRSPLAHPVHNAIVYNRYVWGAIGLCTALLLVAVYVPTFAAPLSLIAPNGYGWALVIGASLFPFIGGQTYLFITYWRSVRL